MFHIYIFHMQLQFTTTAVPWQTSNYVNKPVITQPPPNTEYTGLVPHTDKKGRLIQKYPGAPLLLFQLWKLTKCNKCARKVLEILTTASHEVSSTFAVSFFCFYLCAVKVLVARFLVAFYLTAVSHSSWWVSSLHQSRTAFFRTI